MKARAIDWLDDFIHMAYKQGLCKVPPHLQPPYDKTKFTPLQKHTKSSALVAKPVRHGTLTPRYVGSSPTEGTNLLETKTNPAHDHTHGIERTAQALRDSA